MDVKKCKKSWKKSIIKKRRKILSCEAPILGMPILLKPQWKQNGTMTYNKDPQYIFFIVTYKMTERTVHPKQANHQIIATKDRNILNQISSPIISEWTKN